MALILRRVGRYELLREIGRGGMATVYLARQTDLDRHVALKELATLHASDPAFAERFLRESRMAGSLSHPNIVTVHDYFEHEDTPYIAMEYIQRGSMRPLVGRLTFAQIGGVLEGLLSGMQHAASRGIVHRDLKPENVMITDEGSVKISDFGIGRALNQAGQASRFLTATGTAIGTPAYMAPEQAMAKEVGPWTDLYSLGIMAYELTLGQVPFADSDTPMSMLVRHVSETVLSPRAIDPGIDPQLSEWLERLLQKDPAERPKDAQEAWDRLEEIIIHLLGPRWRREARLLEGASDEQEVAKPLTPAPFSEERAKVTDPEAFPASDPDYLTYQPGRIAPVPGPAPTPVKPAPQSPPPPEVVSEPATADANAAPSPGPAATDAVVEEDAVAGLAESTYVTYAPPGARPAAPPPATPPPEPVVEPEPPAQVVEPEPPAPVVEPEREAESGYLTYAAPGARPPAPPREPLEPETSAPVDEPEPVPEPEAESGYLTYAAPGARPAAPPPEPLEPEPPAPVAEPEPEPEPLAATGPAPVAADAGAAPEPEPPVAKPPRDRKKDRASPRPEVPEPTAPEPLPPEFGVTIPPERAPAAPSFILTDAVAKLEQKIRPGRRLRPVWLIAGLGLVGAIGAAVAVLSGGGSGKQPTTGLTLPAEVEPSALQKASLLVAGPSMYAASPGGSLQRLAPATLKPEAATTDPVGPRAVAVVGDKLYVVDGQTLTTLEADSLAPVGAVRLPGGFALAGGGNNPLVALQALGARHGRLCVVSGARVGPCAELPFSPSGVGVGGSDAVFVGNAAAGTVIPYTNAGSKLSAGTPIAVGPAPHATPVAFSGRLYVPVQRGVAVVDLEKQTLATTIALPATPTALWIAPSTGRLFATLFSVDQVAVVDTAASTGAPTLISAGKGPVAAAGPSTGPGAVIVVNAGSLTVAGLDPASGKLLARSRLPALGVRAVAVDALGPKLAAKGRTVTATIPLAGGSLSPSQFVVSSKAISSGRAALVLWQGGIGNRAGAATSAHGLTVRVTEAPGRLDVVLTAKRGAFTTLETSLGPQGKSVIVSLTTRAPKKTSTTPTATTTAQTVTEPPVTTTTQVVTQPPATTTTQVVTQPPATTTTQVVTQPPATTTVHTVTQPPATTTVPTVTHPPTTTTRPPTTTQTFTVGAK